MKSLMIAIAISLVTVGAAGAQQPAAPADAHHPQGQGTPSSGTMPMMDMCREMMGGSPMAGGGMMGGPQAMDPKMMAHMMEMRGEMMKAMGDIMMKHAKKMNGMTPPTK